MIPTRVFAEQVREGDTLTDAQGRYTRVVVERDDFSNVHGLIVLRTAGRGDRPATGSTVIAGDRALWVMR